MKKKYKTTPKWRPYERVNENNKMKLYDSMLSTDKQRKSNNSCNCSSITKISSFRKSMLKLRK